MSKLEIIHAVMTFFAIAGLLALIWFVKNNRAVALIVMLFCVCGVVAASIGIYLAILFHHYGLILAGIATVFFYLFVIRYLSRIIFIKYK